jgi:hypothetical protein
MKKYLFILITVALSLPPVLLYGADHQHHMPESANDAVSGHMADYSPMPAPGKKVPFGDGYYLIYGFEKKPKLGMAIMKVEIFTSSGIKDSSFEVKADTGMPSMGGAHETGERPFTLSKKGDYLLPINIVMPGEWESRFTIMKAGKVIFRGAYRFDV